MHKAPTIYGLVFNPDHFHEMEAENCREHETYVEFVVRGETKWVDKTKNNVIKCAIDIERLTIIETPSTNMKKERKGAKKEYLVWFDKCMNGKHLTWQVKEFDGGCHTCGSPDCTHMKHKVKIDTMISKLRAFEDLAAEERRHMVYKMAIEIGHGKQLSALP